MLFRSEKYEFEAKNPSTLFVALSRAKSASGRGSDPDFAFHEDVLLNDYRLKLVNTPTTHARQRCKGCACWLINVRKWRLFHQHIKKKHSQDWWNGQSPKVINEREDVCKI